MHQPARRLAALATPVASQIQSPVTLKGVAYDGNCSGDGPLTQLLHNQQQYRRHAEGDADKEEDNELETPQKYGIDSPKGLFSMTAPALLMNQQPSQRMSLPSSEYCKFYQ